MNVLLTDGNFKHTLASVRSLGKRGINVTVMSHIPYNLSSLSKYCGKSVICPNPEKDPKFADFLLDYVKNNHIDVLLPIGYESTMYTDKIREELEKYTKIPMFDTKMLEIGSNKSKTFKFAESIGIRIPKTFYPDEKYGSYEVERLSDRVGYPVVIKGIFGWGIIHYANNCRELREWYKKLQPHRPIIQEYIPGDGYGFFALYNHGECRAMFMHRRVRTFPATGGSSAVSESIYDERLMETGKKLLDALKWHGVAMVEFKKDDRTGEYVLMEINAKFWGSLGIAIDAGVDFPYLACKMAIDGDIEPVIKYKTGFVLRWLFPADIFNVISEPSGFKQFIRDFRDPKVTYDIYFDDFKPTAMQIIQTVGEFILKIHKHKFWNPHGIPNY
jgi:predicted ATP-grasp superfamily ATP-dependent carboligase